jgi:hypothetical protein
MRNDSNLPGGSILSNEALLLWIAIGLAVVFLGLLAFDLIKRRRRARHFRRGEPKGLRAKLLTPVHRAKAIRNDLEQILHERSHRKGRHPRPPPETPP